MQKNFGIIGAGSVGGAFASALHRAGHRVWLTARGNHLHALRTQGLTLKGDFGEYHAEVPANETLPDVQFDLILLCTKAQDSKTAIQENLDVLSRANILVVQNGLTGISLTEQLLPKARVAGGLAGLATSLHSPGVVEVTRLGTTYIGNDRNPVFAQRLIELLDGVIPVEFLDNFDGALWAKLVVNCVNAFPALTNLSMQELVDTELMNFAALSMQEAVRVAQAHGVTFAPLMGLDDELLRRFVELPIADAVELPRTLTTRFGDVPNYGSTLQSLRRGRQSEINQLNGAIVEQAQNAPSGSVPVPVNTRIVDLVHQVERSGKFFTVPEASTLLAEALQ